MGFVNALKNEALTVKLVKSLTPAFEATNNFRGSGIC